MPDCITRLTHGDLPPVDEGVEVLDENELGQVEVVDQQLRRREREVAHHLLVPELSVGFRAVD